MHLPADFKELLVEFEREGVEAVLVGGYAVAFHARPRATKDIDLVLRGTRRNLAAASRALRNFGVPEDVARIVRQLRPGEIAWFGRPPWRVDLLRGLDGVDEEGLFDRAEVVEVDGVRLHVIALDDLIQAKLAAGRPHDLVDVALLRRVRDRRARARRRR